MRALLAFIVPGLAACKVAAVAHTAKSIVAGLLVVAASLGSLPGEAHAPWSVAGPEGEQFAHHLAAAYGWHLRGDWSSDDLAILIQAASAMERYLGRTGRVDGRLWMRAHLGPLVFHTENAVNRALVRNYVLPGGNVYVVAHLARAENPPADVVHEVAHVLDNNLGSAWPATVFGGGPADAMLRDLGGHPALCPLRFLCPLGYRERVAGASPWPEGAYANVSVAEDFADTFTFAMYDRQRVPEQRLKWMDDFVRDRARRLAGLPH
jgi:hypothetical protein